MMHHFASIASLLAFFKDQWKEKVKNNLLGVYFTTLCVLASVYLNNNKYFHPVGHTLDLNGGLIAEQCFDEVSRTPFLVIILVFISKPGYHSVEVGHVQEH